MSQTFNHKEATKKQDVRIDRVDLAAGKTVLELCNHNEQLTKPEFDGYNGHSGYCGVHVPAYLTIDLGEEHNIELIQFLLFDPIEDTNHGSSERGYSYRVLVSSGNTAGQCDKDEWEWRVLCDCGREWRRNWQFIHIPGGIEQVRYIRIHCMDSKKNKGFHIVRLRAYGTQPDNTLTESFFKALILQLQTDQQVPCPPRSYYPIADFCQDLGVVAPTNFESSLDGAYINAENQAADIRELHTKVGNLLQGVATSAIEARLNSKKIITVKTYQPIDPHKKARYVKVEKNDIQYEIGDGFPLSKRLHDTMNLARLMAKRDTQKTSFVIDKRYLQGINSIISKRIDHNNKPTTKIDSTTIYQILDSIADDIELIEQDPKNTERIFLDPVNAQLTTSNKQGIIMLVLTILALVASCVIPLVLNH